MRLNLVPLGQYPLLDLIISILCGVVFMLVFFLAMKHLGYPNNDYPYQQDGKKKLR
ncbi:hypothetical protein [Facilibium subflavum]|uniref:hypothetical protein n=1 Tax=Facilibium subflavum TaxID=2219058 RepID=UPI0013C3795E|nr:hypothetical protein [Facilibium subflavum]